MKTIRLTHIAFASVFILLSIRAMAETNQVQFAPKPTVKQKAVAKEDAETKKAVAFFNKQIERDRLPGLASTTGVDDSTAKVDVPKNSAIFEVRANGFQYHYEFTRASAKSGWKLKKACRTDKDNHVRDYPIYESTAEE